MRIFFLLILKFTINFVKYVSVYIFFQFVIIKKRKAQEVRWQAGPITMQCEMWNTPRLCLREPKPAFLTDFGSQWEHM